jgi:hypothetical protein
MGVNMDSYFQLQYMKELVALGAIGILVIGGAIFLLGSSVKDWFDKHF